MEELSGRVVTALRQRPRMWRCQRRAVTMIDTNSVKET